MRIAMLAVAAAGLGLAACNADVGTTAFVNENTATAHVGTSVPVLGQDGHCTADVSLDPSSAAPPAQAIALGISECDLVRLKGHPPTDVLIGESGKGQREVQVLYQEPRGKTLYLFSDNRLVRIVE